MAPIFMIELLRAQNSGILQCDLTLKASIVKINICIPTIDNQIPFSVHFLIKLKILSPVFYYNPFQVWIFPQRIGVNPSHWAEPAIHLDRLGDHQLRGIPIRLDIRE